MNVSTYYRWKSYLFPLCFQIFLWLFAYLVIMDNARGQFQVPLYAFALMGFVFGWISLQLTKRYRALLFSLSVAAVCFVVEHDQLELASIWAFLLASATYGAYFLFSQKRFTYFTSLAYQFGSALKVGFAVGLIMLIPLLLIGLLKDGVEGLGIALGAAFVVFPIISLAASVKTLLPNAGKRARTIHDIAGKIKERFHKTWGRREKYFLHETWHIMEDNNKIGQEKIWEILEQIGYRDIVAELNGDANLREFVWEELKKIAHSDLVKSDLSGLVAK